jgi:hypothetical protein
MDSFGPACLVAVSFEGVRLALVDLLRVHTTAHKVGRFSDQLWGVPGDRGQPIGEAGVGSQQVDPHPEVARVVEPVVPPREAALPRAPTAGVEVNEPGVEHGRQRLTLGLGHVRETDEGVGVEDVAVGRRHVDVTAQHERPVGQPFADLVAQTCQEAQLVVVVPVPDLTTVRHVDAGTPDRFRTLDHRRDQARFAAEVLIGEVGRDDDLADRVASGDGDAVIGAGARVHDAVVELVE